MHGGRKGTCFQEWGPVLSPGGRRGQPGGEGAAGAAPALHIVFRDPLRHKAQAPAELYLRPDLMATKLNSISSALLQKGGCSAYAPLSTGHCAHSPSSGVLSPPVFLLGPVSSQTPLEKLDCGSALSVTALTPSPREIWSPRPSEHVCGRGAHSPHFQEPRGPRGAAMPSGRASPHAGLGSSWPHAEATPQHRPGRHTAINC